MTALAVSFCSLLVSFFSFAFSIQHLRRSFRPIVSVMVKTHKASNVAIAYDLVVLNSGTLPARHIRITAEPESLNAALGRDASDENKRKWLAAFDREIYLLHNSDKISCSFGTTQANDAGFWKYDAPISMILRYEHWFRTGWFRRPFRENQMIRIADSDSFTGYQWGTSASG
jgi:hypothetical protein